MNQIIVSVQFLARKYATNHNYHMHRCLPNTTVKHWPSWSISIKIGCDIFLGEIHLLNSMCDKMLTIIIFFFFFETFFLILRVSLKDVLQQNGFLVSKICLFSKLLTRWFINLLFHLFVLSTLVDLVQLYEKQYSNWIRSSWKWEFSVLASNWSALFYHSPLLCHFIKNTTI